MSFSYQITATNAPSSFSATGLPAWLTVNPSTGLVTGTPVALGSAAFTATATNAFGTGTRAVTVTVSNPGLALEDALDVNGLIFATTGTPWSRQTTVTYDGTAKAAGLKIYVDGQIQPTSVQADALKGSTRTKVPLKFGQRHTTARINDASLLALFKFSVRYPCSAWSLFTKSIVRFSDFL